MSVVDVGCRTLPLKLLLAAYCAVCLPSAAAGAPATPQQIADEANSTLTLARRDVRAAIKSLSRLVAEARHRPDVPVALLGDLLHNLGEWALCAGDHETAVRSFGDAVRVVALDDEHTPRMGDALLGTKERAPSTMGSRISTASPSDRHGRVGSRTLS